ncbi:MAG: potassium channel family protein [bacterium]|nr:potassium channel family protein [bacterium]
MWRSARIVFHPRVLQLAFLLAVLVVIGACAFTALEGWLFIDSLYFVLATVTTVGYGDVVPSHDASKILTMVYMILTIPIVLIWISLIGELIHDRLIGRMKAAKRRRH